jgi:hypothetical protein
VPRPECGAVRRLCRSGRDGRRELELISAPAIRRQIVVVRERKVMLDEDLAELNGVETGALTRAVRRNMDRFPEDSCSN